MSKISRRVKKFVKKRTHPDASPLAGNRITNETVAEHREKILAGGRKFKYPRQYAKHQLIRNTILILIATLIILSALVWWQLYIVQNTSKFFYRLTQLVPVPVAQVEGNYVRYSDYLRDLRGELHYLTNEENVIFTSEDGKRQLEYRKRASLNRVEQNTYIEKLADEHNVRVTNDELDKFIDKQINVGATPISREQFVETVLPRYYDWSLGEYKDSIKPQLLKQKVAFAIDETAKSEAETALKAAQQAKDFAAVVKKYSDDEQFKKNGGDVGFIATDSPDPEGIVAFASSLKKGRVSELFQGANGYYIIKVTDTREGRVRYSQLFIQLTELDKQLTSLQSSKDIKEFVKVNKEGTS